MKKYFLIITSIIFAFTSFFSLETFKTKTANAASPAIIQSGTIQNTNINYTLDETGLLTISGTGAIPDTYEREPLECSQWKNDITAIDIKNGITSIGDSSFSEYSNLTKVTLADSVQIIDTAAFAFCTSLVEINFPSTMSEIKMNAFYGCSSLESVVLPNGITTLRGLFSSCTNLTTLVIPDSVEEIKENAFFGCTSLKTLTLPKNIMAIHDYSFNGSNFEKIYIPCDSTFEFNAEEYIVNGIPEDIYLSETDVEILESHNFGNWTNIENGKKQRECSCGHIETADITDDNNQNNNPNTPNNNLNNDLKNNDNPNSEKDNSIMIGVVIGAVVGGLTAFIVGAICIAKRKRNSN